MCTIDPHCIYNSHAFLCVLNRATKLLHDAYVMRQAVVARGIFVEVCFPLQHTSRVLPVLPGINRSEAGVNHSLPPTALSNNGSVTTTAPC